MAAAKIAREIGSTERVVRYRIDGMVADKVIQIRPIVNPEAFGLATRADVLLEVESKSIMDVARAATGFDRVSYVACSIGETDVSIQVLGREAGEIYRFVTETIGKLPGVRKITTSIVPVVMRDVYQWGIPGESETTSSDRQVK
jgi:Lrp/AsnC family transcriptional regulator for asnA, asnC and gidA